MLEKKSNEEINKYNELFEKERKDIITNIFENNEIEKLHRFLHRLLPQYWNCTTCIKKDKIDLSSLDKRNTQRIQMAQNAFANGDFSFYFYRTFNAIPSQYSNVEYEVRNYMSSQVFIDFLNSITNLSLSKLNTLFVSKYTSNCFLSTHSDHGNGKIAFVIHISKDWKPQYGGHLHFLNNERNKIIETFCPEYNSLMIFEVPEPNGIPHFVSHVAPNVPIPRIAITGWYE